eukprot:INCI671.1.p1 GENE.INCI671.1~~INCI671.1.p1  ORF type:complete len:566 (-),score=79.03 INCI671.1:2429-4126(-)
MCRPGMSHEFYTHSRIFLLMFGGVTVFLLFVALAADGYFEDHPRYVFEFFTVNSSGDKNFSTFQTRYDLVDNSSAGSEVIAGTTFFYNLTRTIPIGSLHNQSALFFFKGPGGVPGLAVVLLAVFALGQLCYAIANICANCRVVGGSSGLAARIVFFTYGQGIVQLILQYLFFALIAVSSEEERYKAFYVLFAMTLLLCFKNLYPMAVKCCCRNRDQQTTEIELVLLMPHGILAFFAAIQVPIVIAKLGGTYFVSWDVALIPVWMTVLINTIGWIIFICVFLREMQQEQGPFGLLLASMFVSILYNCSVAAALILLCRNDDDEFFAKSAWPYPWWRVVLPTLVAYGVLVLIQVVQILEITIRKLRSLCQQCHNFTTRQKREADEHKSRVVNGEPSMYAAELHPDDSSGTTVLSIAAESSSQSPSSSGAASSSRSPSGSGAASSSTSDQLFAARGQQARFEATLSVEPPSFSSTIDEYFLISQLRSLCAVVSGHPGLATSANRLMVVQRFENLHARCEANEWSELVAAQYGQLVRLFTTANTILRKFPSLKNMRNLNMTRKPPVPPD